MKKTFERKDRKNNIFHKKVFMEHWKVNIKDKFEKNKIIILKGWIFRKQEVFSINSYMIGFGELLK